MFANYPTVKLVSLYSRSSSSMGLRSADLMQHRLGGHLQFYDMGLQTQPREILSLRPCTAVLWLRRFAGAFWLGIVFAKLEIPEWPPHDSEYLPVTSFVVGTANFITCNFQHSDRCWGLTCMLCCLQLQLQRTYQQVRTSYKWSQCVTLYMTFKALLVQMALFLFSWEQSDQDPLSWMSSWWRAGDTLILALLESTIYPGKSHWSQWELVPSR